MEGFFNPFSKRSGIKFQKNHNKELLGTEIVDKTIGENIRKQLDYYVFFNSNTTLHNDKQMMVNRVFDTALLYSGFYPMMAVYGSLMGLHYDNTMKAYNMTEGAKGLLDLLIFPLVARKILTDCREFVGDQRHYQFEGLHDLIVKTGSWMLLPIKFATGLSLELMRHVIPVTLFAAYLGVLAVASLFLFILSIPVSIVFAVGAGIYDMGMNIKNGFSDLCGGVGDACAELKDSCRVDPKF